MQTVNELVASLGGPRTLAERLRMNRTSILGWQADGYIPAARIPELHDLGVPMAVLLGFVRKPSQRRSGQRRSPAYVVDRSSAGQSRP